MAASIEQPFRPQHGCRHAQDGATLVEVLVAALVLAVGVLGNAVLFVHGMQGNRSALLRGEAVVLAADLAERIRANPGGRSAYGGGAHVADAATALAAVDLAQWQQLVAATLPAPVDGGALARVLHRPATTAQPDRFRIQLAWSEPGQHAVWTQSHILDLPRPAAP